MLTRPPRPPANHRRESLSVLLQETLTLLQRSRAELRDPGPERCGDLAFALERLAGRVCLHGREARSLGEALSALSSSLIPAANSPACLLAARRCQAYAARTFVLWLDVFAAELKGGLS